MVIWIMLILHKAGIVEHVFHVGMSWANISSYSYSNSKKSHLDRVVDKEPTVKQQHVVHDVPVSVRVMRKLYVKFNNIKQYLHVM